MVRGPFLPVRSERFPPLNPTTPPDSGPESVSTRALAALVKTRNFSPEKLQLLLSLKEKISIAMGLVLGQWRESRDPVSGAFAEHRQAELKLVEERQNARFFAADWRGYHPPNAGNATHRRNVSAIVASW